MPAAADNSNNTANLDDYEYGDLHVAIEQSKYCNITSTIRDGSALYKVTGRVGKYGIGKIFPGAKPDSAVSMGLVVSSASSAAAELLIDRVQQECFSIPKFRLNFDGPLNDQGELKLKLVPSHVGCFMASKKKEKAPFDIANLTPESEVVVVFKVASSPWAMKVKGEDRAGLTFTVVAILVTEVAEQSEPSRKKPKIEEVIPFSF